ncbi:all-trans-retinol dehydrogenase [NAD(+)] ADH1B-like [Salvia divinorum]|uniref:All-trans-retinol dehydrogenase [NAD(+)] ADH1B-like n=1 Tax=Salvia divinorum TaxID=28513 RepID=A0ABD1G4K0_SALDI
MAFCRSSLLLRRALGGSGRRVAACSSYGGRRWYSGEPTAAAGYHVNTVPSYMTGSVFWEKDKPISYEDFEMPRPKANEVLIKTKACGACHSDLHVIRGDLKFPCPCILGHEITGEVVQHGPHTDTNVIQRYPVGSKVIGAFIMPCGNCFYCSRGEDDLCEPFFAYNRAKGTLYDGETRLFLRGSGKPVYMFSMGGLAEYCVMPANGLTPLPDTLPYAESSVLGCAVFTAYGAVAHAAEVKPDNSIAVIGIGGVGSSVLQISKAFGATEIIAVDVQDEKLDTAKTFGATHAINARKEDVATRIRELTDGRGVDIAVDALGGPRTFQQCIQSVRGGGKAVMIGLSPGGGLGEVDIIQLVRRKVKIIGSYGGRAKTDLPRLVELAEQGIFDLESAVTRKYKFEEAAKAFQDLDKKTIIGRGIIELM